MREESFRGLIPSFHELNKMKCGFGLLVHSGKVVWISFSSFPYLGPFDPLQDKNVLDHCQIYHLLA